MGAELTFTDKIKHELVEHKTELEIAGAVLATAAVAYLGRGKLSGLVSTVRGSSKLLPELTVAGETAEAVAPKAYSLASEMASLSATRPQTIMERMTEKSIRMSCKTAKMVISALKPEEATTLVKAGELPTEAMRKHVFNRFLERMEPGRYVLHGSYALENQLVNARKATNDLDILATDAGLVQSSRSATSRALVDDVQRMANKDLGDGLTFKISQESKFVDRIFPRMRHLIADGSIDGQHVMRIPLDVRVGANTILPAETRTLVNTYNGIEHTATVSMMQKEENLAYKMYTYTNRYAGGLVRKPKDLRDMASMIEEGVEKPKVVEALQSWTSQGYTMGAMRHPGEILGADFASKPMLTFGQTAGQIDNNFRVVKGFYQGIAPEVEGVALRPSTSTDFISTARRFLGRHWVVYPAEISKAAH